MKRRAAGRTSVSALLACAPILAACEPELRAGDWTCPVTEGAEAGAPGIPAPENMEPTPAPWGTGFEQGFCGYYDGSGFCYGDPDASFRRVTEPVRSGEYAAAFDIDTLPGGDANQVRCVREGELPRAAYYGAWYYLPSDVSAADNWNLFHFQGGQPEIHNLLDVSIGVNEDGDLALYLFDSLKTEFYTQEDPVTLPTEQWVHIELFFDRQSDETGRLVLYQDGEEVLERSELVTDDTTWGQWYLGNLAARLSPSRSTVYVDDVTLRLSR